MSRNSFYLLGWLSLASPGLPLLSNFDTFICMPPPKTSFLGFRATHPLSWQILTVGCHQRTQRQLRTAIIIFLQSWFSNSSLCGKQMETFCRLGTENNVGVILCFSLSLLSFLAKCLVQLILSPRYLLTPLIYLHAQHPNKTPGGHHLFPELLK